MVTVKKEVLNKVLTDLNLTNKQVIEEGLLDSFKAGATKVKNAVGNAASAIASAPGKALGAVGNAMGGAAQTVANAPREAARVTGNALQTKNAIINGGLLLIGPKGDYIGVPNIDPKDPTGQFFQREYGVHGYKLATAEERMAARNASIKVVQPQSLTGNLKDSTEQALEQIKKIVQQKEVEVAGKSTLTSQESAKVYNGLLQSIIASIKNTQSKMPSFPGAAATVQQASGATGAAAPLASGATGTASLATGVATASGATGPVVAAPLATGVATASGATGPVVAPTTAPAAPTTPAPTTAPAAPIAWFDHTGKFTPLSGEQQAALSPEQKQQYLQAAQAQVAQNTGPVSVSDNPPPPKFKPKTNGPLDYQTAMQKPQLQQTYTSPYTVH